MIPINNLYNLKKGWYFLESKDPEDIDSVWFLHYNGSELLYKYGVFYITGWRYNYFKNERNVSTNNNYIFYPLMNHPKFMFTSLGVLYQFESQNEVIIEFIKRDILSEVVQHEL